MQSNRPRGQGSALGEVCQLCQLSVARMVCHAHIGRLWKMTLKFGNVFLQFRLSELPPDSQVSRKMMVMHKRREQLMLRLRSFPAVGSSTLADFCSLRWLRPLDLNSEGSAFLGTSLRCQRQLVQILDQAFEV